MDACKIEPIFIHFIASKGKAEALCFEKLRLYGVKNKEYSYYQTLCLSILILVGTTTINSHSLHFSASIKSSGNLGTN